MPQGLVRRLNDDEEGYPDYTEDAAVVMNGLQTVVAGVLVEETVEDLQDLAEGAAESE